MTATFKLRCLNPVCRRYLVEVVVSDSTVVRAPCPRCGGETTIRLGRDGVIETRSFQRAPHRESAR